MVKPDEKDAPERKVAVLKEEVTEVEGLAEAVVEESDS